MIDRRLMRDVAVAVLLAVPTVALSRPQTVQIRPFDAPTAQPLVHQVALADRTGAERRFAL